MEKKKKEIVFKGYRIENLNLQKEEKIDKDKLSTFNLEYSYAKNKVHENEYRGLLIINDLYTNKSKINIELSGFFEIPDDISEEIKNYFLEKSAPAILYPYLRTIVSNITAFDIDDTVVLPILNFADNIFIKKENKD